ncbi:hypothetical protein F5Y18DRAFT_422652 [Xylariaceae sp. FL1019]|nr:hypothetical protein F5Y18DRAFT_422652 [Xylariaceae sp. FL1019]
MAQHLWRAKHVRLPSPPSNISPSVSQNTTRRPRDPTNGEEQLDLGLDMAHTYKKRSRTHHCSQSLHNPEFNYGHKDNAHTLPCHVLLYYGPILVHVKTQMILFDCIDTNSPISGVAGLVKSGTSPSRIWLTRVRVSRIDGGHWPRLPLDAAIFKKKGEFFLAAIIGIGVLLWRGQNEETTFNDSRDDGGEGSTVEGNIELDVICARSASNSPLVNATSTEITNPELVFQH